MPRRTLTDRFCASAKVRDGEMQTDYFDEKTPGLALRVSRAGLRSWTFHFTQGSSRKRMTFGNYPTITLVGARKPKEEPESEEEPSAEPSAAPNSLANLTLPGVAGDVQDYFLRSTMHPSHIMSIAVGLMVPTTLVCGAVIGPSGPKGCALHQNLIYLGPTRIGKQRAIDCTNECVCAAGDSALLLIGPNRFKSDAAMALAS